LIYLDNNASTQPDSKMLGLAMELAQKTYANPSSSYEMASAAREALATARTHVANALGCQSNEIIFTSGGTESNSLAIHTSAELGEVAIGTATEHSSIDKCTISKIQVTSDGLIDLDHLDDTLSKLGRWVKHKIVSVMLANNETGVITDPQCQVPEICKKHGALLHVDAVQGFGKSGAEYNVESVQADTMAISAHKIHGLKGAGALFIREGTKVAPLLCGGPHEFGIRPGTENQLGIFSLGFAAAKIKTEEYALALSKVKKRRDRLEDLLSDITDVNGHKHYRIDNTTNLYFPDVSDSELFIDELSAAGIVVSGRSACASGLPAPSRVLRAMFGKNSDRPSKSIRLSLSIHTTDEDIEIAATTIRDVANSLVGI
jgi:cysteine desulfurase